MQTIRHKTAKSRKLTGIAEQIKISIEEAKKRNQSLLALRTIEEKQALLSAERLDKIHVSERNGYSLYGTTFSAKDHIDIKGYSRSEGSLSTLQKECVNTATSAQALIDAGAICLGKGNMAQYGKSYFTRNRDFGTSKNPYNLEYSPGGSSGGDAAAVAAGLVDFALTADSGGSTRLPANFCGLYGLLPTMGVISDGLISSATHTTRRLFRSLGPICRTLDDLEVVFKTLRGFDPRDPRSVELPNSKLMPASSKQKIGYLTQLNGIECDREIKRDLNNIIKRYKDLGYDCQEVAPTELEQCYEIFIILAGQTALLTEDLIDHISNIKRDPLLESEDMQQLRSRIKTELPTLSLENLLLCWYRVDLLRNSIHQFFEEFDFLLMPVSATPPVKLDSKGYSINGEKRESQQVFQFASCINVLGLPALAFPTSINKSGLPLGLQIVGPRFSDLNLFSWLREAGLSSALGTTVL